MPHCMNTRATPSCLYMINTSGYALRFISCGIKYPKAYEHYDLFPRCFISLRIAKLKDEIHSAVAGGPKVLCTTILEYLMQ